MEIYDQETQEPSIEDTLARRRYSDSPPSPADYLCCDADAPMDLIENADSSYQGLASISAPRAKLTGVGVGLMNIGNTCFVNAVLQCVTHTVPLLEALQSSTHPTPCHRHLVGFCVLCSLGDHVRHSLTTRSESISPAVFFRNLNFFSSSFVKYCQEDAHEFLQCFLDKLSRCFPDSKTDSCSDENLVTKVFGGSLISRLKCCNCGYSTETPESSIDLSLGIEDVDSLTGALASFTKAEKIEDSEPKFQCENCKEEVDVVKKLAVDEAPTVAVFHLKRFKVNETYVEKIDNHVKFPLELDLKSYTIDADDDDDSEIKLEYNLYGVIVHSGSSIASGHYFSFIKTSSDKWHRLDDDLVTEVSEEEVLSQNAYILFYARRGIPWFSSFVEADQIFLDPETRSESPKSVLDNIENDRPVSSNISASASTGTDVCSVVTEIVNGDNCTVMPLGETEPPQDEKLNLDELFSPLTPPRPLSPDPFSFDSPEPSYQFQIQRDHLKSEERPTRKRLMNRSADESEKKEAVRYLTRSMPSSRGSKLMEAIFGPQSEGAAKKKRKLESACKRAGPVNGRHKSGHASVPHPVVEFLR